MWRPGAEPPSKSRDEGGRICSTNLPADGDFQRCDETFWGFASFLVDFVSLRFTVCHTRKTDEKSITFFISKLLTIQNENEYAIELLPSYYTPKC